MNDKVCNTCNKTKKPGMFRWRNIDKGIRFGRCKACDKKQRAEDYKKNVQKYKKRNDKAALARQTKVELGEIVETDKTCMDCNLTLSPDQFRWKNKRLGYRVARCKQCDAKHRAEVYSTRSHHRDNIARSNLKHTRELRKLVEEYKTNKPCVDCGVIYPPYVMDFDHLDPTTKVDKISRLAAQTTSKEKLLAEIAKCDLVCANCHRERTYYCKGE